MSHLCHCNILLRRKASVVGMEITRSKDGDVRLNPVVILVLWVPKQFPVLIPAMEPAEEFTPCCGK